ncbi:hypothetical protein BC834DRAFT_206635 [Gloeopeniophorella convolvens]|nr:hypothetical protein BC834DRAFT_206635 [Gloeopeniophorella convolvens]
MSSPPSSHRRYLWAQPFVRSPPSSIQSTRRSSHSPRAPHRRSRLFPRCYSRTVSLSPVVVVAVARRAPAFGQGSKTRQPSPEASEQRAQTFRRERPAQRRTARHDRTPRGRRTAPTRTRAARPPRLAPRPDSHTFTAISHVCCIPTPNESEMRRPLCRMYTESSLYHTAR